jgi:hypothetical protein
MSTRRPTIGTSPLDALLDGPRPSSSPARPTAATAKGRTRSTLRKRPTPAPEPAPTSPARIKVAYLLPAATVERARNAAVALAGYPCRYTIAGLVTDAIDRLVDTLEREHNRGKAFPPVTEPLRGGRPPRPRRT